MDSNERCCSCFTLITSEQTRIWLANPDDLETLIVPDKINLQNNGKVKIKSVLETIFSSCVIDFDPIMCSTCAKHLQNLYNIYTNFLKLLNETSKLNIAVKKVKLVDVDRIKIEQFESEDLIVKEEMNLSDQEELNLTQFAANSYILQDHVMDQDEEESESIPPDVDPDPLEIVGMKWPGSWHGDQDYQNTDISNKDNCLDQDNEVKFDPTAVTDQYHHDDDLPSPTDDIQASFLVRCTFNSCDLAFPQMQDYINHYLEKHASTSKLPLPPGKYQCLSCPFHVSTLPEFQRHVESDHKQQEIKCPRPLCPDKSYGTLAHLKRHHVASHPEPQLEVPPPSLFNLKLRPPRPTEEIRENCPICGKSFLCLKKHLVTHDGTTKRPNYPCDLCDTSCKSKVALIRHKENEHVKVWHVCTICWNRFSESAELNMHLELHKLLRR